MSNIANLGIQKDFIDGINEVFSTMFTDGKDSYVSLYQYVDSDLGIYQENRNKKYKEPIKLVAQVKLTPTQNDTDVEVLKDIAVFTVPYKSLRDNNLDVSTRGLRELRKGYIKYKDTFYEIEKIRPTAFVEDVFLIYTFECKEDVEMDSILLEIGDVDC